MGRVFPITHSKTTRQRLLDAVGRIMARQGPEAVRLDAICLESGVRGGLVFKYFGGVPGLVVAYSQSPDFWPTVEELLDGREDELRRMCPEKQIAVFFKSYLAALRRRPRTLRILAWESLQRNELSKLMEDVRVRTALEFFEYLHGDIPDAVDLSAIVVVLAAAVNYLAVRSTNTRTFGGVDLESDLGWARIEQAIDLLMQGTLNPASLGLERE